MSMTTTAALDQHPTSSRVTTLADEHRRLLQDAQRRVAAVETLIDAQAWPSTELADLTGFLRATLLRQASDEESVLYPHDATAAPFAELSAAHARLYELTEGLEEARARRCPLPQLRGLVEELFATLRSHLDEEEAVLADLAADDFAVPAAIALSQKHRRWPAVADDGPVVIRLDALPDAVATRLCIERLLRLRPGEQAVVHSRDRSRLHDVCAWLHEFDAARYAPALSADRSGGMRLNVTCRDTH